MTVMDRDTDASSPADDKLMVPNDRWGGGGTLCERCLALPRGRKGSEGEGKGNEGRAAAT